ncbi:PIF1-like helicase-domain-containing protein [Aspergillus alliaceus]|uniref:PIF1-like helicase-domain-containing protein n=1 Tax=Petromyces alliaceus TaxID=209559 RepID=UPI0012A6CCF4|nr:PIF1-like helicase-domain-containing protein [Aspergillus alliaceus]KAB8228864.1 PIF1-like helicase-domain-containing protein [Aspergillus alliaceus]
MPSYYGHLPEPSVNTAGFAFHAGFAMSYFLDRRRPATTLYLAVVPGCCANAVRSGALLALDAISHGEPTFSDSQRHCSDCGSRFAVSKKSAKCGPCRRGGPLPPASQDRAASVESTASVDSLTRVLSQVGITDPTTWRPDFTPEPSPVPIPDTTRRSDPSTRVPTTKVCGACGKRRHATAVSNYCRLCLAAVRSVNRTRPVPLGWRSSSTPWQSLDLGPMDRECPHCGALYWRAELYPSPTTTTPSSEKRCRTGCLPIEPMPDPPPPLIRQWLSTNIPQAKLFRKWIRILNSAISYTSVGYRHDPRLEARETLYIFQLQGAIYHMRGPLRGSVPSHTQLYFMDMESANALRLERYPLLKYCPVIHEKLDKVLRRHNPFYKIFFRAFNILNQFPDESFLRLSPQLRLVPNRAAGHTKVKCPKSYEDLRTVPLGPGEVPIGECEVHVLDADSGPLQVAIYRAFRDACYARNIIPRNNEWSVCFKEAITLCTGWELRRMFVSAMLHGDLDDARPIWNGSKEHFCERLMEEIEQFNLAYNPQTLPAPHLDYGLYRIAGHLNTEDKTLSDFGLSPYINDWGELLSNPLLRQELDYDPEEQDRLAQEYEASLNKDQRTAYERILSKMEVDPYNAHFFLHGPEGTRKTFLYRTLCARLRAQGKVVLCVPSTGIASLLLPGGRTAHNPVCKRTLHTI